MEEQFFLQVFENIPITYDDFGRFTDARSRDLFILLFEENVKSHGRISVRTRDILLRLAKYIDDSPILLNVSRLELMGEIAGVDTRSQLMYWMKKGRSLGFIEFLRRRYASSEPEPIVLHAIPYKWDASMVRSALKTAYPLEWEETDRSIP